MRLLALAATLVAFHLHATPAHHSHYPHWWIQQAKCVHENEAAVGYSYNRAWRLNWHLRYYYGTHTESSNRGGFQIGYYMWNVYAPHGWTRDPAQASRAQQVLVAWRIWYHNGKRWGGNQWPHDSRVCGIP